MFMPVFSSPVKPVTRSVFRAGSDAAPSPPDPLQILINNTYTNSLGGPTYPSGAQALDKQIVFQDFSGAIPAGPGDPVGLKLDASYLFSKRRIGRLTRPAGFPRNSPVDIYRDAQGDVTIDYVREQWKVVTAVERYVSPDGDDGNDGLTDSTPKRSFKAVVTELNALGVLAATIFTENGQYFNENSFDGVFPAFNCNVICETGRAVLALTQEVVWTKTADRANVWQCEVLEGTHAVSDQADLNRYGQGRKLYETTSVASVDANPRTIYREPFTTTLFAHFANGREPDVSVLVFQHTGNVLSQVAGANIFFGQNLDMWGGALPYQANVFIPTNIVLENCTLRYSASSDGIRTNLSPSSITLAIGGDAAYNFADGYNYNGSHLAFEYETKGVYNGLPNSSDNGSTAHGNVVSIRVKCDYRDNADRNIHDIGETRNWLINCISGDGRNGSADRYLNAAYTAGRENFSDATYTWMENCISEAEVGGDVGCYGGSVVQTVDCTGLEKTNITGTGQIIDDSAVWTMGYHAYQYASAKRPTVSATTGKLAFNGGQSLETGFLRMSHTNEATVIARVNKTGTANAAIFSPAQTNSNRSVLLLGGNSSYRYYFRSQGTSAANAQTNSTAFNSPTENTLVGEGSLTAPLSRLRIDGVQVASVTSSQGGGNYEDQNYFIGVSGDNSNFLTGEIGFLSLVDKRLSLEKIEAIEQYLAA